MKYLHTMVRVSDLDASLAFYRDHLGLEELRRYDSEAGRYTLVFLAAPGDQEAQIELTVLGAGTNVLVSDRGVRGITVRLAGALRLGSQVVEGIRQVRGGARLGDIGAAIQEFAEGQGCSVVRALDTR